ncbi:unnamed protein product [Rhizophagus irregularis]|nr:unnamed protein product [Rhizophagus irregularis]CAB5335995.1 unnamed protein product [Rhizophagus irregularis]
MPEEFKQLEIEAVDQDPDFRPKITKMFEVLRNCVKDHSSGGLVKSPPNKDKIVAELFKEVADDEADELPDAKLLIVIMNLLLHFIKHITYNNLIKKKILHYAFA